jgi:hypothetical protein
MILWHVNALHLAKNCIVMQKMNHHSLQSTQQWLAIALSMYVIQIWRIIIDATMTSLWWHHVYLHIQSSLVFFFYYLWLCIHFGLLWLFLSNESRGILIAFILSSFLFCTFSHCSPFALSWILYSPLSLVFLCFTFLTLCFVVKTLV